MSRPILGVLTLFLLILLPAVAYCFAAPGQNLIPEGCDEFGYLQMARAFEAGRALDTHAPRPFDTGLVAHLQEQFAYDDYGKLITPHAYHVDPVTGQVINQYPPATSYLLSWLPIDARYALFPALAMGMLLLPLVLVLLVAGNREARGFQVAMVAGVGLTCLFAPPFDHGFETITSIAPTYGLWVGAGFLLRRHPRWALLLIGVTTVFRVANIITAMPVLLLVTIARWRSEGRRWRALAKGAAVDGTMVFLGGLGLYFGYVFALLGNPLRSTYSKTDQAWLPWSELGRGLDFYFEPSSGWMWAHLVAFGLMVVLAWGNRDDVRWTLLCLLVPLANYAFYVAHKVQIPYYPYASSLLLVGLGLELLDSGAAHVDLRKRVTIAVGCAIVCIVPMVRFPHLETREPFEREAKLYRETLADIHVVWAELRSGTVEYLANTAGFRYGWGKPEARIAAMRFLQKSGYTQAILTKEQGIDRAAAVAELKGAGIRFEARQTRLGPLLVIPK